MKRADRAATLIALYHAGDLDMTFIASLTDGSVHVAAADADQPEHDMIAWALGDTLTVCGRTFSRNVGGVDMGAVLTSWFADSRLCQQCHAAFGDRAALIFEHNKPQCPNGCPGEPGHGDDGRWYCDGCGWFSPAEDA